MEVMENSVYIYIRNSGSPWYRLKKNYLWCMNQYETLKIILNLNWNSSAAVYILKYFFCS